MIVGPSTHLTYCLNIHRGESWTENFDAIREKATAVRDRVAPGKRFGLGLRLSARAARELAAGENLERLREFLGEQELYVFTINGFPHGLFHQGRVKEQVYAPDWQTEERRDYTLLLADLLAELLPEGMEGSISTVPGSFKGWILKEAQLAAMGARLMDVVDHMDQIWTRTGKLLHLGLEPEPACFLETTEETIAFFEKHLLPAGNEAAVRRHLGVCFDTCHTALQFEDPDWAMGRYAAEGIRVSKIQLSAALSAPCSPEGLGALEPFCEPVYLHQVKARQRSGDLLSWIDLPEALAELPGLDAEEARVHFHVPLYYQPETPLDSTIQTLTPAFWNRLAAGQCGHLEIETYTFDVLPPHLRACGVVESIAREFESVIPRLATTPR